MARLVVWIIDDDMVSQFATNYSIEQASQNCRVVGHYSAHEAMTYLEACQNENKKAPDILLLDLVMPDMDGWHFLKVLEKMGASFKKMDIYILSAFTNSKDRKRAKGHPMIRGFFDKPLTKVNVDQIFSFSEV